MKQKRKAKQLIKHGKVGLVDIRRARKEGRLADVAAGEADLDESELDEEDVAELEELKAAAAARAAERSEPAKTGGRSPG
jgi:hypothetical protein